jgi:glutamate-1-semialdehyde aminotransferase
MANKVRFNENYPEITESEKLINRADKLIPAFSQTLAKGPTQWVKGVAPNYLVRGKGSRVWDADGNEFLDYNMGIGPLILGYCNDRVDNAIKSQLEDGITFSMMHPLEVIVAEKVNSIIPNAESVRFSKTGAEVTTAAVRLARAFTKRDKVLCCGYHGWHDWYISVTDRNSGIPGNSKDLTYTFNYNDLDSLKDALDEDVACVILEPMIFEMPKPGFLESVQELCRVNGSLLIFDEMWTGFRMALGGAQQYFGITPDLAVYSKAVANGMPVSLLTGKEEYMNLLDKEVFFFSTFGGEALSLAAAMETMNIIEEENVPDAIFKKGKLLKDGYNKIAESLDMPYTKCTGYDARTIITFNSEYGNSLEMKSLVQQEMIKLGILWGGFHNMCYAHTGDDIQYTLRAYDTVLPILKKAVEEKNISNYLKGKPVEPVFRKTTNFKQAEKV